MKYLVTGAAGFIGSHLTDRLILDGHKVLALDNFSSGFKKQINRAANMMQMDLRSFEGLLQVIDVFQPDGVFHLAAIARTPWCMSEPRLAAQVNVIGTLNVLEAVRRLNIPRVVLSSSNVVYAAHTPYRASKEMLEMWAKVYDESYGVSSICLRYSNVYGTRQSELGPSPNVFAALRKSKRENGYLEITGDGEQSRDFTHVSDIVEGNVLAMKSDYRGTLDLCTGVNWSLNEVAGMFGCTADDKTVRYLPERHGDVKHIVQDPVPAQEILGWKATVALPEGIQDCL